MPKLIEKLEALPICHDRTWGKYEERELIAIKQEKADQDRTPTTQPTPQDVIDAERWRYFKETASEEICYAICGNSNAENEELDKAIDQAMKDKK